MLKKLYSDAQVSSIREQAFTFHCACPGQVCVTIDGVRELYDYQMKCLDATDTDREVHLRLKKAAEVSHEVLEQSLTDVLHLEGWDMQTLKMPDTLRKRLFGGP